MIISKVLTRSALVLGTAFCLTAASSSAQEVYSSIIGAVSMKVPAGSDLYVTPSFNNSAVFRSDVSSAAAGSVSFSGAAFEPDSYASGHHLLIEEGTLAGRMFEITGNTATVLTVSDPSSELAAISDAQPLASVVPVLTIGEMFPNGLGGKVEANPGNPDLILFSNDNSAGVEGFAPESIYYYGDIAKDNGGNIISEPGWRKVGSPLFESHDDDVLPLGEGFVVRNNSGVDASFFLFGEVMLAQVQIPIASKSVGSTDNLVGVPRPLAIAIGDLGLETVVSVTSAANAVKDTVRIYSNNPQGKNPSPDIIYCLYSDGWRSVVDGAVVTTGDVLDSSLVPAASAVVVRKVATTEDQVVYWTNSWSLPTQS
ncbi:TIGR02597 family protein [Pelagicoccus sp. SDUM812002]|uniref:TIGR02597 family protein n=1 Tax=Pelagicoccus sp. SDUM812002 TaxID=3041266 RepID=UPI00280D4085|nr:TIGR02597 family protein [Pelagicoccus sp. SDUM812002]MDQ8185916.1 TIGR02597 family protein [Pelagicoccus sp. SDUM812002]